MGNCFSFLKSLSCISTIVLQHCIFHASFIQERENYICHASFIQESKILCSLKVCMYHCCHVHLQVPVTRTMLLNWQNNVRPPRWYGKWLIRLCSISLKLHAGNTKLLIGRSTIFLTGNLMYLMYFNPISSAFLTNTTI